MAPNARDNITGAQLDPAQTVRSTTVYRRYSRRWRTPRANSPVSGNQNLIPGPLLRARVGDRLVVHFKNMDFTRMNGHSMHFHGVEYKPSSGADSSARFTLHSMRRLRARVNYTLADGATALATSRTVHVGPPAKHHR